MRYRGACSHGKASVICRGDPGGRGIGGDVDPHQVASPKPDDHQTIEQLEAGGRHDEQIHRTNMRDVVAQEGLPALRWRPESSDHVLGHRRLCDLEAELEQLAVDTRCIP
jgi:hypothetical protein